MGTMKRILLGIVLLLLPILSLAQQGGTYRDQNGNTTGTWSDNGDRRIYRDAQGNMTGSSSRDNDRRDYRDEQGNYMGSRDRDRRD